MLNKHTNLLHLYLACLYVCSLYVLCLTVVFSLFTQLFHVYGISFVEYTNGQQSMEMKCLCLYIQRHISQAFERWRKVKKNMSVEGPCGHKPK